MSSKNIKKLPLYFYGGAITYLGIYCEMVFGADNLLRDVSAGIAIGVPSIFSVVLLYDTYRIHKGCKSVVESILSKYEQ